MLSKIQLTKFWYFQIAGIQIMSFEVICSGQTEKPVFSLGKALFCLSLLRAHLPWKKIIYLLFVVFLCIIIYSRIILCNESDIIIWCYILIVAFFQFQFGYLRCVDVQVLLTFDKSTYAKVWCFYDQCKNSMFVGSQYLPQEFINSIIFLHWVDF